MFLENVFGGKNDFGRWLAMLVILTIGTQVIGLIPLGVNIFLHMMDNPDLMPDPENPLDLSAYEISPVSGLALMIIPLAFGLVTLLLLMKPIHERSMLSVITGGSSFRWKRFLWGCSVWLLLITIYSVLTIATGLQKIELQFDPGTFISLILVSLLLLPFQAGFQETFFRGYLMQGFAKLFLNRWAPLLITAFLFAVMHYFKPEIKAFGLAVTFPLYIWFGIFFGLCTLMDEGIELALGAHTINSIFLSIFFTKESSATLTPSLFYVSDYRSSTEFIGMLILSLAFIYLAKKQFAWPEWGYLLAKIERPLADEEDIDYKEYEEYDEYEDDND